MPIWYPRISKIKIVRIVQRAMADVHSPISAMSAVSSLNVEPYASGFARISKSTRPRSGRSEVRTSSRRRRLTRFLATTLCRCLGTTIPTLGCKNREADARASRRPVCIRFPVRLTASRSASLVSLLLRGKRRGLGAGVLCRQLNGKPLTSLLAPPAQNFAAPFSSHSQPKTMGANSALVAGTVGRLAHL
jgi:hypothetical protein